MNADEVNNRLTIAYFISSKWVTDSDILCMTLTAQILISKMDYADFNEFILQVQWEDCTKLSEILRRNKKLTKIKLHWE